MITALVQFPLPQPMTRGQAREIFLGTTPKYRETPGPSASTTSGAPPTVTYFESPVVVDNAAGEIVADA